MKVFGRILCWMGLHSWYDGLTSCYCVYCGDILFTKKPFELVDSSSSDDDE